MIVLGILIALAVSVLCGLLNGVIIAYARVPAIIATLGTQGLFLGISIIITKGHGIGGFPPAFLFIGNGSVLGMPTQFVIFVVVALLVGLVLTRTPQGFSMLMYGSSPQVARFSGDQQRDGPDEDLRCSPAFWRESPRSSSSPG